MEPLLYCLTFAFILVSLLPFLPLKVWWARFLESLRPILILLLSVLFFLVLFMIPWSFLKGISLGLMAFTIFKLVKKVIVYTSISSYEIRNSPEKQAHITVLIHNVLMSNDNIEALEQSVRTHKPDLLLLIEFTEKWQQLTEGLRRKFADFLEYPLDSGYGMALYAQRPLNEKQIRFLVEKDIPSVDVVIETDNGKKVRFFGIHPAPPAPQYDYDTQTKDQEGYELAKRIKQSRLPAIVAGDLNDINWSGYVKKFKSDAGLLDPRIGRGIFPTFHAQQWMINYPLDHIFASAHFDLFHFERVPLAGSDHHGLKAALVLREQER